MRKLTVSLIHTSLALLLIIPLEVVGAQVVTGRASAVMTYGPPICGTPQGVDKKGLPVKECRDPSPLDFQEAQRRAALAAVERFVADGGEDQLRAFERIRDSVRTRFDEIIMNLTELNRVVDPDKRQVTMAVRVDINEAKLRLLLQATSSVAKAGEERSLLGMFLVAREQVSRETFGAETRTSASVKTTEATGEERSSNSDTTFKAREVESLKGGVAVFDGKISSVGAAKAQASTTTESAMNAVEGSSSVERAAKVLYNVAPAQDLDAVIGSRLAAAGYETVEAAFLEDDAPPPLIQLVRTDFGSGDDLKPSTLRRIAAAAQKQEVKYTLVGTVDMTLPDHDEVSGNPRVYAKVQAKVYDVTTRIPRTVVNVGPAQYAGTGPNADVAKTNALKNAASEIAKAILDQLSNRQVR
jgi:hypothetical protein